MTGIPADLVKTVQNSHDGRSALGMNDRTGPLEGELQLRYLGRMLRRVPTTLRNQPNTYLAKTGWTRAESRTDALTYPSPSLNDIFAPIV